MLYRQPACTSNFGLDYRKI